MPNCPPDRAAEPRADGTIAVRDRELELHVRPVADRRPGSIEQAISEGRRRTHDGIRGDGAAFPERPAQQRLEVEMSRRGRVDHTCAQQVDAPDDVVEARSPSDARSSRTSWATDHMNASTISGVPANFARSSGRCVAIPIGHVSGDTSAP